MKKSNLSVLDSAVKKIHKADVDDSQAIEEIDLTSIVYPENKTRSNIDSKSLMNLYANIQQAGLLTPILVREAQNSNWEIISGVKRVLVFQQMGKPKIPAIILKGIDDKQAIIMSISDNLNRDDLNAFDQVYSFLHLMAISLNITEEEVKALLYRLDNFERGKITQLYPNDQAAQQVIEGILAKFGKIKISSFVIKMKIMGVNPALVEAVRNKGLHYTIALELNKIKDEEKLKALLADVLDHNLALPEVRAKVKEILGVTDKPNPFQVIAKKFKGFYELPEDKQKEIQDMVARIQDLLKAA